MLFIPPHVRKMTPKLLQICGCEIFIIPKDMWIDLNIFRERLVTDLQHNSIRRHTRNSLFSTTSVACYKDNMFPDGECLHAIIKYDTQ